MRRRLSLLFSMLAFVLSSVFFLSACEDKELKMVGISIDMNESSEYVLTDGDIVVTYGTQLSFTKEDFVVSAIMDNGSTQAIGAEAYTLSSTLPENGITPAGSYTITFSHDKVDDVVIDVIVHQADKEVGEVQWNHDGSVPFVYDKNTEITMEIINVPEGISVQYTGTTSAKTVGRYTTTAHFTADDPNYVAVPPTTTIEWEITKANIVVPTVTLKNYTYAEDTNRTAEINEQLPEDVEVSYSGETTAKDAGTYNVTVSFTYTGDDASNYNAISSQETQWTIEKAEWSEVGTVELVEDELTYNGANQTVQVNENKLDSRVEVYEITGATQKNANENYTATAKLRVIGNDNYYIDSVNLNWEIAPATLTAKPRSATVTFGEAFDSIEYDITGFVGGEDESIVEGTLTCVATTYSAGNDAGTYDITLSGELAANNYTIIYDKNTLTVVEKGVSVAGLTWDYENPFTYNGDSQNIELTSLPTGIQAVYTYKLNNVETTTVNAGTYTATVELTAKKNYTLTDTFATTTKEFIINKKDVTINVNNKTIKYTNETSNNGFEVVGLIEGETKDVFTGASYAYGTYTTTSNVGTYDITVSGLEADNYNVATYNKGVLTVEALPIDLSQISCTWNYENPFTYSAQSQKIELSSVPTGLIANYSYTLKGETTEIDPINAGTYVATVTFTALNDNYVTTGTLTNNTKEFVINKAKVTVKANDAEITFGEDASNNGFEVVSGLLGEDTKAVFTGDSYAYGTYTTTSNVGTYDITISGLVADNYEVETYQAGTLTVEALPVSVEGYSYVWDYEDPLTYNKGIQGILLSSTAPTGLQATYTYTVQGETEETTPINAGTYTATATFVPVNSNYVVSGTHTNNTQEFVISPATINITSLEWDIDNGYEFVYDGETSFEPTITNEIENISFTYKYFDYKDLSNPLDEVINAGEYRVVATLNYDAENYRLLTSSSVELYKDYAVNNAPLCVIEDLAWSVGETTSGESNSIKEYYINYDYTGEAYNQMTVNGLTDMLQVKFYNDEDDSQIETLSFTEAGDYRIYAVITLKDEYANNYVISNQYGTGGVTEVVLYLNISIVDIPEIASLSAQVYSFDSDNSVWEEIAGSCYLDNGILTGIKATDDKGVDYTDVRLFADEDRTKTVDLTDLNNVPYTIYYSVYDNEGTMLKEDCLYMNYSFVDNNSNYVYPNSELNHVTTNSTFSVPFTVNNTDLTVNSALKVSGTDTYEETISLAQNSVTVGTYRLEITLNSTTYYFEIPFSIINSISIADALEDPEASDPQLTFTSADETDTIVMTVDKFSNSVRIENCTASDYVVLKSKIAGGEYSVDFPIVEGYVITNTELIEADGVAYLKLTIAPEVQTFALNEDSDTYILIRLNLSGKIDSDTTAKIILNSSTQGSIDCSSNFSIEMTTDDYIYFTLNNYYANWVLLDNNDDTIDHNVGYGDIRGLTEGTYSLIIIPTDGSTSSTYTIVVTEAQQNATLLFSVEIGEYTGDRALIQIATQNGPDTGNFVWTRLDEDGNFNKFETTIGIDQSKYVINGEIDLSLASTQLAGFTIIDEAGNVKTPSAFKLQVQNADEKTFVKFSAVKYNTEDPTQEVSRSDIYIILDDVVQSNMAFSLQIGSYTGSSALVQSSSSTGAPTDGPFEFNGNGTNNTFTTTLPTSELSYLKEGKMTLSLTAPQMVGFTILDQDGVEIPESDLSSFNLKVLTESEYSYVMFSAVKYNTTDPTLILERTDFYIYFKDNLTGEEARPMDWVNSGISFTINGTTFAPSDEDEIYDGYHYVQSGLSVAELKTANVITGTVDEERMEYGYLSFESFTNESEYQLYYESGSDLLPLTTSSQIQVRWDSQGNYKQSLCVYAYDTVNNMHVGWIYIIFTEANTDEGKIIYAEPTVDINITADGTTFTNGVSETSIKLAWDRRGFYYAYFPAEMMPTGNYITISQLSIVNDDYDISIEFDGENQVVVNNMSTLPQPAYTYAFHYEGKYMSAPINVRLTNKTTGESSEFEICLVYDMANLIPESGEYDLFGFTYGGKAYVCKIQLDVENEIFNIIGDFIDSSTEDQEIYDLYPEDNLETGVDTITITNLYFGDMAMIGDSVTIVDNVSEDEYTMTNQELASLSLKLQVPNEGKKYVSFTTDDEATIRIFFS